MSTTPSITLTGPQNEYMYKKTLGVGYEYPNTQPSTETISSLPYIFNEQIIPQIIPIPAPDKITQESITGGGTKWTTNTPYIFYYEKLPLNINPDSFRYSFVYNSTQIDNLTTQSIPSKYDPNQSYNIFVFDVNNTPVIDTNYIFDNATGCSSTSTFNLALSLAEPSSGCTCASLKYPIPFNASSASLIFLLL